MDRDVSATGTVGDIITEADGQAVTRLTELTQQLERAGPGSNITLTVTRADRTRRVDVQVVDIDER